jgi:hypothetical protein
VNIFKKHIYLMNKIIYYEKGSILE